jgi:phosphopantetheine--protein transferase-like protein
VPFRLTTDGGVEVWLASTRRQDGVFEDPMLEASLGADELTRLGQTDNPVMARQRLVAYALRRDVLGRVLGMLPKDVPLRFDADGRASLGDVGDVGSVGLTEELSLGLSHTEGMVAFALMRGARVGIDVERVHPRRGLVTLARRCFHPAEAARVESAAPDQRPDVFFRLWTAKESFAKASGRDLFEVLPERVTTSVSGDAGWRVIPFEVSGEHVGAVTVELLPGRPPVGCQITIVDKLQAAVGRAGEFDTLGGTVRLCRVNTLTRGGDAHGSS